MPPVRATGRRSDPVQGPAWGAVRPLARTGAKADAQASGGKTAAEPDSGEIASL